jgi:hypothetical protein
MRSARIKLAAGIVVAGVLGVGAVAVATGGNGIDEELTGFEEVPALSTPGVGEFRASIDRRGQEIRYRLSYDDLESPVTQAHIHFENRTENGPIVVFLCSNLGNGPAGTQACPADGGTVRGTIRPADVLGNAQAQGLAAGEFGELVRAMRAGATYVNVHSQLRQGGEIRAQIEFDDDRDRGHNRGRGGDDD